MDAITTQVLNRFSALCAIPRPSGGEAAVTAYLTKLLTEAGYAPETDSANNLRCALPGHCRMHRRPRRRFAGPHRHGVRRRSGQRLPPRAGCRPHGE